MQPELKEKIASLMNTAQSSSLLQNIKSIFGLLSEAGLMYSMTVPSKHIGIHPCNRDGYGVNPHDVHELLESIAAIGWDKDEAKGVAVEVDNSDQEVVDFNSKAIANSNGLLAPLDSQVRFASLWGSHTNQCLRAWAAGVRHKSERLTIDGKLCVAKLRAIDPAYASAVEAGMNWQIIASSVVKEFPELPLLVQAAGNTAAQLAKNEHDLQVLRKVFNAQRSMSLTGGRIEFGHVRDIVLRSKPKCGASLPGMYKFAMRFAGGASGKYIDETEQFVKGKVSSDRTVDPEVWEALAMDFVKGEEQAIFFRHALIRLIYTSDTKCTAADVKRCGKDSVLIISCFMKL